MYTFSNPMTELTDMGLSIAWESRWMTKDSPRGFLRIILAPPGVHTTLFISTCGDFGFVQIFSAPNDCFQWSIDVSLSSDYLPMWRKYHSVVDRRRLWISIKPVMTPGFSPFLHSVSLNRILKCTYLEFALYLLSIRWAVPLNRIFLLS